MSTETNQSEFDRELLSAYVDGELTGAERAAVEAQLASDPAAQRQVEEFRRLSGLIQGMPRPKLPADLTANVLRRAQQGGASEQVETQRTTISIGRTWRGWAWAGAALAAALMVALWLPEPRDELARNDSAKHEPVAQALPELRAAPGPAAQIADSESEDLALLPADDRSKPAGSSSLSNGKFSVEDSPAPDSYTAGATPDLSRLLIVRVSMPAEAVENRAFERVLARNGIEIEPAHDGAALREEDSAAALADRDQALDRPVPLEQRSEPVVEGLGGEAAGGEHETANMLLVEAPAEQIAQTLSSLQSDAANFGSVEVEERSPLLQLDALEAKAVGEQWRQFNRAATSELLRESLDGAAAETAPSEAALAEAASPESRSTDEAALERALSSPAAAPATAPTRDVAQASRGQIVAKGRAYRYRAPTDGRQSTLEELTRLQTAREKQAAGALSSRGGAGGREARNQPLQVLFLLENAPLMQSGQAPAEAAEPVQPAAPAAQPR